MVGNIKIDIICKYNILSYFTNAIFLDYFTDCSLIGFIYILKILKKKSHEALYTGPKTGTSPNHKFTLVLFNSFVNVGKKSAKQVDWPVGRISRNE